VVGKPLQLGMEDIALNSFH